MLFNIQKIVRLWIDTNITGKGVENFMNLLTWSETVAHRLSGHFIATSL